MISYTGKLVRLRPIQLSDKAHSIRWRNDPEVRDNVLGYRFPVTDAMEDQWYQSVLSDQSRTRAAFAIEDITDGACIGFIQLTRIDWISRHAHLAIVIGEKARHGKGLGNEALHLLVRYGFGSLNLRRICLEVPSYNARAKSFYEEFGFVQEGSLRQHVFLNGAYHELDLMGLMQDEYEAKHGRRK